MDATYMIVGRKSGKTMMMARRALAEHISKTYHIPVEDACRIIADVINDLDDLEAQEACQK